VVEPKPVEADAAHANGATVAADDEKKGDDKKKDGEWDPAAWRMDPAALAPLEFKPLTGGELMWARLKMAFALPWRRFKKGSVLTFKVRCTGCLQLMHSLLTQPPVPCLPTNPTTQPNHPPKTARGRDLRRPQGPLRPRLLPPPDLLRP
jgi:hypothetical protein